MSSDQTVELLKRVPGGHALLAWFERSPDFGDAEVLSLHLDREADSLLTLLVFRAERRARVTFVLEHWIDVSLHGFSSQNVIAGLTLNGPEDRVKEPWELGVGCRPGDMEITLAPCFGACGSIRGNLKEVRVEVEAGSLPSNSQR